VRRVGSINLIRTYSQIIYFRIASKQRRNKYYCKDHTNIIIQLNSTNIISTNPGIRSCLAVGGQSIKDMIAPIRRGCEIIIGTPGRLIDTFTMSNGKITNLRRVSFLILDEADRMLDMGFEPQIRMFIHSTQPEKQVGMFSATFPDSLQGLAKQYLKKPVEVRVGTEGIAAGNIVQKVIVMSKAERRIIYLLKLLGEWHMESSVIIFCKEQKDVTDLYLKLNHHGYACLPLHGGMDQEDRQGKYSIMWF
jgi:ATP-dependent RNA helicase DDX46/PRP5